MKFTLLFGLSCLLPAIAFADCSKQAGEAVLDVYPYQNGTEMVDEVKLLGSANTGYMTGSYYPDYLVYSVSASDEGGNYLFLATLKKSECGLVNVTRIVDEDH